jgi:hypothetical protein
MSHLHTALSAAQAAFAEQSEQIRALAEQFQALELPASVPVPHAWLTALDAVSETRAALVHAVPHGSVRA